MNVKDFDVVSDYIFASTDDGWYFSPVPNNLTAPEWEKINTPDPDGKLPIIGTIALQVVEDGSTFWVEALLANNVTDLDVNPFALYISPSTGLPAYKEWTNFYPDAEGGTDDSMPRAGRCEMWGDFLVLGDIIWKADSSQPFASGNASRYSHGLWFSQPGNSDKWDPMDTVFVGQKSGGNVVQGLFPIERGLLVITCTLVSILIGTPDEFSYRELRSGISNCGRNGVSSWPSTGGVVWADRNDDIWWTDGEDFTKLNGKVSMSQIDSIGCFQNYIIASSSEIIHVFRVYGGEMGGGWTRLSTPYGVKKIVITRKFMIGLEDREVVGNFVLDDPVFGLLDSNILWGEDLRIIAFDFEDNNRGVFDNKKVSSIIRSKPLPGSGHDTTFWHRFGVRAEGSGVLKTAISRPSADSSERGYETRIYGRLGSRKDYIFDAHGPSLEATFDVEFDGDVTAEHMTVWTHKGTTKR
jgi:hypothetical protein